MREHLNHGRIVIHPFVTTELALGSLRNRSKTLALQVGGGVLIAAGIALSRREQPALALQETG